MSDASLISGPVEFDPTEPLPVVRTIFTGKCNGVNVDGSICNRKINSDREYCIVHDPTPDEALRVLWRRITSFVQNCEQCGPASAEELLTLSAAYKAMAILWDRKIPIAQKEELVKRIRFTRVG